MGFSRGYQYLPRSEKKGRRASEGGALANYECYGKHNIGERILKRFVYERAAKEYCDWYNQCVSDTPQYYFPGEVASYRFIGKKEN